MRLVRLNPPIPEVHGYLARPGRKNPHWYMAGSSDESLFVLVAGRLSPSCGNRSTHADRQHPSPTELLIGDVVQCQNVGTSGRTGAYSFLVAEGRCVAVGLSADAATAA
jgi:hypothetical protein